ncbi:MAG: serine/threonine-protein kinase, partial [Planctomycetota bacterium]
MSSNLNSSAAAVPTTCPSQNDLVAFIQGSIQEVDDARIAQHVNACETCQESLEQITASDLDSCTDHLPDYLNGFRTQITSRSDRPQIPGYEIDAVIGRGGMGIVYRAQHQRLGRQVALKVISGDGHRHSAFQQRFQHEGRAIASLDHPCIVRCFDSGEIDGIPFLTFEYIAGGTLADHAEALRDPHAAAKVIRTLARTIQAAHDAGIVHRDIKPNNILMAEAKNPNEVPPGLTIPIGGRVLLPKLTDFGISQQVSADDPSADHSVKSFLGTPGYISPEQASKGSTPVTYQSDLFSIGVVFYELLTGKRPFDAERYQQTLQNIRTQTPPPASSFNSRVPQRMDAIIQRCLEKSPQRRFQSASQLADALNAVLRDEPNTTTDERSSTAAASRSKASAAPVSNRSTSTTWKRTWIAITTLALFIATAVVLFIQTNQGKIEIRIDDPDLQITIKRNGQSVQEFTIRDDASTRFVATGDIEISIPSQVADRYSISDSKFELSRGQQKIVTIQKIPDFPGDPKPDDSADDDAAPDRVTNPSSPVISKQLVDFFVRGNGAIQFWDGQSTTALRSSLDEVSSIRTDQIHSLRYPRGAGKIPPALLDEIGQMINLEVLHLQHSHVTDNDIQRFKRLTKIKELDLFETDVTDASIDFALQQTDLFGISVGESEVTPQGLLRVSKCPI